MQKISPWHSFCIQTSTFRLHLSAAKTCFNDGFTPLSNVWARKMRVTAAMTNHIVTNVSAMLSAICQNGTSAADSRATIATGAVSGNKLSAVATPPFGSLINTLIKYMGKMAGKMIKNVYWAASRCPGMSAPNPANAEA